MLPSVGATMRGAWARTTSARGGLGAGEEPFATRRLAASAKSVTAARTPGGGAGASLGRSRCSQLMTSAQIGAAPVTPLTSCIGSPEKLPTQTPTV